MARYVRIMDMPNERSSHHRPTPRSGGVAIVVTFLSGAIAIFLFADVVRIEDRHFFGVLACTLAVAIVSGWDDITQRSFMAKLVTQLICTAVILAFGLVVKELYVPGFGELPLGWMTYLVSAFWLIGLTNTVNFMDGLDGLVGGVVSVALIFLAYIAFRSQSHMVYLLSCALLAGVTGFLVLNWSPAKIFMGDVGSAFLGFTMGVLAIIGSGLDKGHLSFYVIPLLLFNLIFDAAFTFFRRAIRGEKLHLPHREHLYQLLHRSGWGHAAVAKLYIILAVVQGAAALFLMQLPSTLRFLGLVPFFVVYSFGAVWILRRARRSGL